MNKDPLPKSLFDILACPTCKSDLIYDETRTKLICTKCKKEYDIKKGIPVLLSRSESK